MTGRMPLVLLAALVAGLGALNWHIANTEIDVSPLRLAGGAKGLRVAAAESLPRPLQGTTLERFPETTRRPVFSSTRRPPGAAPVAPPPVAAKPEPARVVARPDGLRLAGIMQDESGPSALIVTTAEPNGRWCKVNGEIEGWRLTAIQPGVVRMEAGGQRHELKLDHGAQ
jgi:hypothetical protein